MLANARWPAQVLPARHRDVLSSTQDAPLEARAVLLVNQTPRFPNEAGRLVFQVRLSHAQQLKLRATQGKTSLRRLGFQSAQADFALGCPQFQLPGTRTPCEQRLFKFSLPRRMCIPAAYANVYSASRKRRLKLLGIIVRLVKGKAVVIGVNHLWFERFDALGGLLRRHGVG